MNKEALIKALLEFARVGVIAILPIAIEAVVSGSFSFEITGVAMAIALLKAVDKYLHKLGVLEENDKLTKGLVQF